jgi:hypothetical protein
MASLGAPGPDLTLVGPPPHGEKGDPEELRRLTDRERVAWRLTHGHTFVHLGAALHQLVSIDPRQGSRGSGRAHGWM